MDDRSVARRLVEAVISDALDYKAGLRPVHTIGIGVKGYFEASDVARTYCIAEHFGGRRVPVSVRFSNGIGSSRKHDGWSDVRGMATRFHLENGGAVDLIAMTLGEFFVRTVDEFFELAASSRPTPVHKEPPWRKLLDMLQLKLPLPDPPPGKDRGADVGALAYANRNRFAQLAVLQTATIGAPVSYVRAAYHAVHTFIVTGADGVRRPVRFSWKPVAGVRTLDPDDPPVDSYLQEELEKRLKRGPARFLLMMTIGEPGDALDDPSEPWPARRVRVIMGTLFLTAVAKAPAEREHISFNPLRLVPGIDPSEDPILLARRDAYEVSREMRGGTACPFHRS